MISRNPFSKIIGVFLLLLLVIPFSFSNAQSVSFVTNVASTYHFGTDLTINGQVESKSNPDSILLILQPEKQSSRQIPFQINADDTFTVTYDLTADPLKPFSRIYYWFQVEEPDGSIVSSPSYWFDYFDNRFTWNMLESKLFRVFWTGDDSFYGQVIHDIAKSGLEKATQILPVAPELPISIYVYPDTISLKEGLSSSSQEWVAGHASPEVGVVLVSKSADGSSALDLERQIPHELMHILQYQVTGEDYKNAPAWFLEGLATYSETYPNPDLDRILKDAQTRGTLIPFDTLCQVFPVQASEASIAYAQSLSFIKFLEANYGSSLFNEILDLSKSGVSCDQIIKQSTGISTEKLTSNWVASTFPGSNSQNGLPTKYVLYILLAVIVVVVVIILIREITRKRNDYES